MLRQFGPNYIGSITNHIRIQDQRLYYFMKAFREENYAIYTLHRREKYPQSLHLFSKKSHHHRSCTFSAFTTRYEEYSILLKKNMFLFHALRFLQLLFSIGQKRIPIITRCNYCQLVRRNICFDILRVWSKIALLSFVEQFLDRKSLLSNTISSFSLIYFMNILFKFPMGNKVLILFVNYKVNKR